MSMQKLGEKIKLRRKFLKISQKDLSEISGISERTLRDIENGKANPELDSLINICDVLGMQLSIDVIK